MKTLLIIFILALGFGNAVLLAIADVTKNFETGFGPESGESMRASFVSMALAVFDSFLITFA